jgi:WbqC-like protein family
VKLAIMQPYFFPYLGYFQLVHAVDRFVMYDDVAFIKQGWVNRNRILINSQPSFVTVPLKQASSFRTIRDIEIDDSPQNRLWPARFLKSVDNAYRRAPQFERVFPLIESVLHMGATKIGELARASVRAVAKHIGLDTEWVETSTRYGNANLAGQERLLAICRAEQATEYINASGGIELYSREEFARAGIALRFLASSSHEYRQFGAPFVPWLSIIDVLMFNTPAEVGELMRRYDLT